MTPVNLGVCFGPSLLRPEFETVSSIYDIKFRNAIVELIIIHYDKMFKPTLEQQDIDEMVIMVFSIKTLRGHIRKR